MARIQHASAPRFAALPDHLIASDATHRDRGGVRRRGAAAGVLLTTIALPRRASDTGGPPSALESAPPNHSLNMAGGRSGVVPDGRTLVYAAPMAAA